MRLRAPVQGGTLADIEILKGVHKKAFYQGLYTCGRVWHCPVCAAKISERRRLELKDALAAAEQQLMRIHFVTLTIPHGIGDDIKELNGKLSVALGKLSSGRASIKNQMREMCPQFEQYGYIRAFEVTHGRNGFHPHYHIIVFTSAGMDSGMVQTIYSRAWQRACFLAELPEPSAEHGVTVQDGRKAAEYASKWGLEDEMTKAHMKQTRRKGATPWGLLRAALDGDDPEYPPERATALFRVYAEAFAGRRQLYWSNGLRKLLQLSKELTDEELANAPEDERSSLLATLTT
ncbi:MAG: protein rep, partial [Aeromonas veronii]